MIQRDCGEEGCGVGWGIVRGERRERVMKILRDLGRRPRKDWLSKPRDENFVVKRNLMALHA